MLSFAAVHGLRCDVDVRKQYDKASIPLLRHMLSYRYLQSQRPVLTCGPKYCAAMHLSKSFPPDGMGIISKFKNAIRGQKSSHSEYLSNSR